MAIDFWLGLDPGFDGAVAILDAEGQPIEVFDCPTYSVSYRKGKRRMLDLGRCCAILRKYQTNSYCVIEQVNAMPRQGVTSSFRFGESFGCWQGCLAALNIPYTAVRPAIWKKQYGLGSAKADSILKAAQLLPASKQYLTLKKHSDRAEALLLAHFGASKNLAGILKDEKKSS